MVWLNLVERSLWEREVASSNIATQTKFVVKCSCNTKRVWSIGWALAFQAKETGSSPVTRSNLVN